MTNFDNNAEQGTQGTTPTSGNSGGNGETALDTQTIGSGCTLQFDSAGAKHGSFGYRHVLPSGNVSCWQRINGLNSATRAGVRVYFRFSTVPTVFDYVLSLRSASAQIGVMGIGTDGKLIMQNRLGTSISASKATNAIAANTWYRLEAFAVKGTGTGDGTLEYAYYLGESTTAEFSWSATNVDAGTANLTSARIGRITSSASSEARTIDYDGIRLSDPSSGPIGLFIANGSVTAVAATVSVAASAPVVSGGGLVSAVAGTVSVAAVASSVTAGATVQAVAAAITVSAPAPAVTADAAVSAVAGSASGAASAPSVSAGALVQAVAATVTASASAPTVTANASVTAVAASVSVAAPAPAVSGGAAVASVAATVNVDAPAPSVSTGTTALVDAVPAAVTADALAPTLSIGSTVDAVAAGLLADALVPSVSAGATVLAVPALTTVSAHAPTVTVFVPRNIDVTASLLPRRWAGSLEPRKFSGGLDRRRWEGGLS